jgi:benzoate transport porin
MKRNIMAVPLLIAMAAVVNCAYAKEMSIDVTLKNLYADRDFDDATKPSVGSWSQGIIARAKGEHELTQDFALTFTGSVQYAQRLSDDKHLNDMILLQRSRLQITIKLQVRLERSISSIS